MRSPGRPARHRALSSFLLAAVAGVGCGEQLEHRARFALKHGRLDMAAQLAERLPPERAEAILAEVAARRAVLAAVTAEVDALLAGLGEQHPNRIRQQLRDLLARQVDPAAAERVERALSELSDHVHRAASSASATSSASVGPPARAAVLDGDVARDAQPVSTSVPFEIRDTRAAEGSDEMTAADDSGPSSEALDPERAARSHEARGELERAIEAWREAAARAPLGPARASHLERAHTLAARVELYAELAAAARGGRFAGASSDVSAIDADGLVLRGETRRWRTLPVTELWRLAERVELTPTAESGLLEIALSKGDEDDRRRAREHVRGALAEGRLTLDRAEALFSLQVRPDANPAQRASPSELARWASELTVAGLAERDELFDRILAEGGAERAAEALRTVWNRGLDALRRGETLARLEQLAATYRELEAARAAALELIFDASEYFYPYRAPECPPARARLYPLVQTRVEGLVSDVRELWRRNDAIELEDGFGAALLDLRWVRRRASRAGLDERGTDDGGLEGAAQLPDWIWGLPRGASEVTLQTFAPSEDGRLALRRSAAIRDYNRRLWEWAEKLDDEFRRPRWSEQRQVQITNDYREMFGRTALAWSPLLQESARIHARYMARTGDFGHFQQDPELETPRVRMLHVGYSLPGSENCATGTADPMGAHAEWTGSSGHHRNLLEARHTEMASALETTLWAQNFGRDDAFAEELDPWSD